MYFVEQSLFHPTGNKGPQTHLRIYDPRHEDLLSCLRDLVEVVKVPDLYTPGWQLSKLKPMW